MQAAHRAGLPGQRWHFQHGPIDLVIGADGTPAAVHASHDAAWNRFASILGELVSELAALRAPVGQTCPLHGPVARRMWQACHPFRAEFITPMAAVAGAVAQELIGCYQREGVARAWINNGGDIALHLVGSAHVAVGLCSDLARFDPQAGDVPLDLDFEVRAAMPVRGIATSGWRGRSHSRGIADSVTVLAATAAQADAAATVIANAVNVEDPRVVRRPACELKDDSDLGALPVTVLVPSLPHALVREALSRGRARAQALHRHGLIHAAFLVCQRQVASVPPRPYDAPDSPEIEGRALGSLFA